MSLPAAERAVGQSLDAIDTPALLIDLDGLEANIAAMAALCAGKPQRLRPHERRTVRSGAQRVRDHHR